MIDNQDLKARIRTGLLSFPVTPFGADGAFAPEPFRAHLEWLSDHPVAGLIVAGGTGELFSLTPAEVVEVVRVAKQAQSGQPIISGCGYGTRLACEMARGIEAAGGDGILLLPHYLIAAPQDGIEAHIRAVCKSTRMGGDRLQPRPEPGHRRDAGAAGRGLPEPHRLQGRHRRHRHRAPDHAEAGRPAEPISAACPRTNSSPRPIAAPGSPTYSSAVFNFVPRRRSFFNAFSSGDDATCERAAPRVLLSLREYPRPQDRLSRVRDQGRRAAARLRRRPSPNPADRPHQ